MDVYLFLMDPEADDDSKKCLNSMKLSMDVYTKIVNGLIGAKITQSPAVLKD